MRGAAEKPEAGSQGLAAVPKVCGAVQGPAEQAGSEDQEGRPRTGGGWKGAILGQPGSEGSPVLGGAEQVQCAGPTLWVPPSSSFPPPMTLHGTWGSAEGNGASQSSAST